MQLIRYLMKETLNFELRNNLKPATALNQILKGTVFNNLKSSKLSLII